MPCANCRKDLPSTQDAGPDGDGHGSDSCHAFLHRRLEEVVQADSEDNTATGDDPIPISAAISTLFEASLKLHKKQVSSNSRLLMCPECLSSLTELHETYSRFMKLTLEGSYIQQLLETSVLWPNFKAPHRFNLAYDDFSPLVEVKLEPEDDGDPHVEFKEEDPDFNLEDTLADEDSQDEIQPRRRSARRKTKKIGKISRAKHAVLAKKLATRRSPVASSIVKRGSAGGKVKMKITTSISKRKTSGIVKQYPCPEDNCTKSFNDEKLLRRHIKFKHGQATPEELATRTCYECPNTKIFGIPSQLKLHQREVHGTETPFPCPKCDRRFPTKNRLRIHTLMKHPSSRGTTSQTATEKKPLVCPHNCETPFRSKVSLKLHLKAVHGELISYNCELCGKSFQRGTRYRRHLKYKHGQGLTADDLEGRGCTQCSKVFETRHQLKSHVASVHSKEKPFVCEVEGCGKKFPSKNYLNIHWHMRHKKEPVRYPCEHCGKSYCSKTVLQEHIETLHLGVRNIICEICGKACTRQSALNRHMETHDTTRQKLLECSICHQKFISERTLKSHAITHSGVRDQQCSHCGDTFLHSASLRRHLHAKHGIRPTKGPDAKEGHECKQCGKVFKLKEYLSQHLRSRTHGGKGHTAQRKRETTTGSNDDEPFDGRRFKRSSSRSGQVTSSNTREITLIMGKRKSIEPETVPPTTYELPPVPQQIFWSHESLLQGTPQYFRQ